MLKGIDPLLNADVLGALRAMGHGDDLIIADTNFPADSVARQTRLGHLLRIDVDAARAVRDESLFEDVTRLLKSSGAIERGPESIQADMIAVAFDAAPGESYDPVRVGRVGRPPGRGEDLAGLGDDAGEDVRPADVDPDGQGFSHRTPLSGWRTRCRTRPPAG